MISDIQVAVFPRAMNGLLQALVKHTHGSGRKIKVYTISGNTYVPVKKLERAYCRGCGDPVGEHYKQEECHPAFLAPDFEGWEL